MLKHNDVTVFHFPSILLIMEKSLRQRSLLNYGHKIFQKSGVKNNLKENNDEIN